MKKFGGNYKLQALVLAVQFILIVSTYSCNSEITNYVDLVGHLLP